MYCIDVSTGKEVWIYSTVSPPPIGGRPFSPIVEGNRIFVGVDSGNLYCLDAYTGAKIWNFTPSGYGSSPSLFGSYIYASFGDRVYALNASTGMQIWNQTIGGSPGHPLVMGGYVYLTSNVSEGSSHGIVSCLNASTGAKRWSHSTAEYLGFPWYLNRGYIYVGAYNVSVGSSEIYDSKVYAFDALTGAEVWSAPTGSFSQGPVFVPFVVGQSVFVSSGNNIYALDASSGAKRWNYTTAGSTGSPYYSEPYVYVGGGDSVYCLNAKTGTKIWNSTTEIPRDHSWEFLTVSSPVGGDGQVYVGSVGPQYFAYPFHHVYALNASTGKEIWDYTIEGNGGRITVAGDILYVSSSFATTHNPDNEGNSTLYALKPTFFPGSKPPTPIIVTLLPMILAIAIIVVGVILIVMSFVLRIKTKKSEKPPTAQKLP